MPTSTPTITKHQLDEIQRHARAIMAHPHDCKYWADEGCAVSMLHDAEDIFAITQEAKAGYSKVFAVLDHQGFAMLTFTREVDAKQHIANQGMISTWSVDELALR